MANLTPIVHVGYPKCASTTLQKHLFDRHSQLINLGLYPTHNVGVDSPEVNQNSPFLKDKSVCRFYHKLVMADYIEYANSNPSVLRQQITDTYCAKERIPLFSHEMFTAVSFCYPDVGAKALRIKETFPRCKILVMIRNQISLAISEYRDHPFDPRNLTIGLPMSPDKWFTTALDSQWALFFRSLDYHRVLQLYWRLFGKENVGIFLFEEFVRERRQFTLKVSQFMGIGAEETHRLLADKHENRGVSSSYNRLRSIARRYPQLKKLAPERAQGWMKWFVRGRRKQSIELRDETRARAWNYFAAGNRSLMEETGLDLVRFGYPH